MTLKELTEAVDRAEPQGASEGGPTLPLIPLGEAARSMFPSLFLSRAEANAFAHGQAPRRSHHELIQWGADVGLALLGAGSAPRDASAIDDTPIAAVDPGGNVLGLLRIDAARLRTVLVF